MGTHTITYTYTDANNCEASATSDITVTVCTGVNTFDAGSGFEVFPNPGTGIVNIEAEWAGMEEGHLIITSSDGKLLRKEKMIGSSFQLQLDLSGCGKGIYFIQFIGENGAVVQKSILVY